MTGGSTARRLALVAGTILILDQATKWIALDLLDLPQRVRIEAIPGLFALQMGWNRGVNFGLFAGGGDAQRWALAALAVAVAAAVAAWAMRRREPLFTVGAGLLVGGALGNGLDRVRFGAVADFLNVTCCGVRNPYAFNVADIAIFLGALALVVAPSREPRPDAAEERR